MVVPIKLLTPLRVPAHNVTAQTSNARSEARSVAHSLAVFAKMLNTPAGKEKVRELEIRLLGMACMNLS